MNYDLNTPEECAIDAWQNEGGYVPPLGGWEVDSFDWHAYYEHRTYLDYYGYSSE